MIRCLTSGLISERQTFAPAFSNFSAKALPSPTCQSWWWLVDFKDDIDDYDDYDDDHEDEVDAAATDDDDDNDGKCGDAKGDDGGNEGDDGNEGGDSKGGDDGNQGGDGEGGDECNEGGEWWWQPWAEPVITASFPFTSILLSFLCKFTFCHFNPFSQYQ